MLYAKSIGGIIPLLLVPLVNAQLTDQQQADEQKALAESAGKKKEDVRFIIATIGVFCTCCGMALRMSPTRGVVVEVRPCFMIHR